MCLLTSPCGFVFCAGHTSACSNWHAKTQYPLGFVASMKKAALMLVMTNIVYSRGENIYFIYDVVCIITKLWLFIHVLILITPCQWKGPGNQKQWVEYPCFNMDFLILVTEAIRGSLIHTCPSYPSSKLLYGAVFVCTSSAIKHKTYAY